jgi:hypothetical protein
VVTGVTFYLQAWIIEKKGPVFLAMSTPVTLVFTMFFSAILLCEIITLGRYFNSLFKPYISLPSYTLILNWISIWILFLNQILDILKILNWVLSSISIKITFSFCLDFKIYAFKRNFLEENLMISIKKITFFRWGNKLRFSNKLRSQLRKQIAWESNWELVYI